MKNTKRLILAVVIFALSLGNFSLANAADTTPLPGQVLGVQVPPDPAIITAMKNAKAQLAAVKLNYTLAPVYTNVKNKKTGKTTKTLSSYNLNDKDIALAIFNPGNGETLITVGNQAGKTMVFKDPKASVTLLTFNGVNSRFKVDKPAGGSVLALKYLITGPESGTKAAIEGAMYDAYYTPYSPLFSGQDVLDYGSRYLDGIIASVAKDLTGIPSQAVPGKNLTDAIKPSLIKALVYAEHTDTNQVLVKNDAQGTINQLNILFALNGGDTYKYSVSSAGARGIAQFIPSTYKSLVTRHPEARLIPDFVAGMSDHANSIKAMYLLLDDYAGTVRVKAASSFAEARVFEYGAASYNGGTTRVVNSIKTYGANWGEDHWPKIGEIEGRIAALNSQVKSLVTKVKKTADKKQKASLQTQLNQARAELAELSPQLESMKAASLRNETVNYLAKIYKVIQYFSTKEA